MFKIIYTLLVVRYRKFMPHKSIIGIIFLLLGCSFMTYILNTEYETIKDFYFITSTGVLFNHLQRKDIELLKLHKNFRMILFSEYLCYSLPFIAVLVLRHELLQTCLYVFLIFLCVWIPKIHSRKMSFPFQLFDPFWHIGFRKNKLILLLILALYIIIMGVRHKNDNLILASFFITTITSCVASFSKEAKQFIKVSVFDAENYLKKQFKTGLINTAMILLPTIIQLVVLQKWYFLLFIPFVFVLPIINILLKYVFFENELSHIIAFSFIACSFVQLSSLPITLILLPFMYKKALKNMTLIKC